VKFEDISNLLVAGGYPAVKPLDIMVHQWRLSGLHLFNKSEPKYHRRAGRNRNRQAPGFSDSGSSWVVKPYMSC
jgi:hypothetical protein